MADDAETKKIARLDFNIDKALSSLDKIDLRLKTISESSEKYAKNIGLAINNGVDYKEIAKSIGLTENELHKLTLHAGREVITTREIREREAIKTTAALERENTKQEKSITTLYDKISNYASTYLIYQGFNVLKRSIGEVIDEMVELESSMVQIDRVLNESSLNIDNYRDKLMQTAYDYGNSMSNVADITLRLAQAGFDSNESLKLTEKTLLALNTAELNATQATDDMVAVMAQWGYMTGTAEEKAEQYGAIIDKINKVADNFPTTSADIMDALKKVSSAFNLAGADIDETIATIVAAEKASQRGGKVIGTALSNIVQQIKAEGKLNLAEQLGLNFFKDANKTEFKPIMEIFQEMSDRMATLKSQGKESSTEMQQLLELFTVFRRNIGASLLGEMEGGEESTYMQVYKASLNSVGYSLQENAKYMATAKAAQEQFNTSVLQLKTQVWDSGVEDVYKSMLIFGKELVGNIGEIVDKFGGLPTIIGTATLAFSLLSKQMKAASFDTKTGTVNTTGFVKELTDGIKKFTLNITNMPKSVKNTMDATSMSFTKLKNNLINYGASLDSTALKTLALKAATIGLNLAASAAATAGMMLLTSIIQELVNKEAAAIQLQEKSIQSTEKQINAREDEITNLQELMASYDDLAKKTERTPEETIKLHEIQAKIKDILGEQANTIDLINGKYDEQKKKLEGLTLEQQKALLEEKKKNMEQKKYAGVEYSLPSEIQKSFGDKDYEKIIKQYGGTLLEPEGDFAEWEQGRRLAYTLKNSNIEEAVKLFTEWEEKLRTVDKTNREVLNTYNWVNETLNRLKDSVKETDDATKDYYETLASIKINELFPEGSINNAEQYKDALEKLQNMAKNSTDDTKILADAMMELFIEKFPQFVETTTKQNDTLQTTEDITKKLSVELSNLQSKYDILTTAQKELNETGNITAATFKNLVDNNLLEYLDVVNGKLQINEQKLINAANAAKEDAKAALQEKAAKEILNIVIADLNGTLVASSNEEKNMSKESAGAASSLLKVAAAFLSGTATAENFQKALRSIGLSFGTDISGLSERARKQINNVISTLNTNIVKIDKIKLSVASVSSGSGGSSRRSSSGSSTSSSASSAAQRAKEQQEKKEKEAKEAQAKKEKEEYDRRYKKFTETLKKMQEEEEHWVRKQKELGLLSNKDMLYVTKQRINEYDKYLKKVKEATWMNTEDRVKLQQEYTKKLKELKLEYFEYLKGKLDDEVKAIEDARDKKIKALEEETDKRIDLLKKQREAERDANDRQEILDEIEYWSQRTGRDAVENLAEAKKKLAEFDRDAQIDAQIAALEEQEKKQKESLERQAQNQINALQKVYNSKIKAFSESNKIIFDNSVIAAKNLYKAYKSNFVDPLNEQLKNINKKSITYTVKKGDTLESIAKKYGISVNKIKSSNASLAKTNAIKQGQKLTIPMFHGGGIFDGASEGLALLKKGEWILRPEWSNSLNRMMKYFDNVTAGKVSGLPMGNNSTIEVERKSD